MKAEARSIQKVLLFSSFQVIPPIGFQKDVFNVMEEKSYDGIWNIAFSWRFY